MNINGQAIDSYRYEITPFDDDINAVIISQTPNSGQHVTAYAYEYQDVINSAWKSQFGGTYSTAGLDIAKEANPHDHELLRSQESRLRVGNTPNTDAFVHAVLARAIDFSAYNPNPDTTFTPRLIGVASGSVIDTRPRIVKIGEPAISNQRADISSVFTRPSLLFVDAKEAGVNVIRDMRFPHRGIGTALLRSLLDAYPKEMQTVAHSYTANTGADYILRERLGFRMGRTWAENRFGARVELARYHGATVGKLIAWLEHIEPSLHDRQKV